jgi:hypothetical protein
MTVEKNGRENSVLGFIPLYYLSSVLSYLSLHLPLITNRLALKLSKNTTGETLTSMERAHYKIKIKVYFALKIQTNDYVK